MKSLESSKHRLDIFLFSLVILFSGMMVVNCSPTSEIDLLLRATTNRRSREKKLIMNGCSRFLGAMCLGIDESNVDLLDAKLSVTSQKKINYVKDNITSDYFSETADDYPELSKVEHLLEDIKQNNSQVFLKNQFEGVRILVTAPPPRHMFDTHRGSSEVYLQPVLVHRKPEEYIPLCTSHTETIKPRKIRNINGDYVKVVNYDEYEQAMFVEVCGDSLGNSCGSYAKHFPNGVKSICRQHFIRRRTAIFAESPKDPDKPIEFEDIPIPAACVCDLIDNTF